MTSFKESVLVPLSIFQTAKFSHDLAQTGFQHMPTEQKLKILDTKKFYDKTRGTSASAGIPSDYKTEILKESVNSITQTFPQKDQPLVRNILQILLKKESNLRWGLDYTISINGESYDNSDVRKLLNYAIGNTIITSEADKPVAADRFIEALRPLVPAVWLKIPRPVRKRTTRKKRKQADGDDSARSDEEEAKALGRRRLRAMDWTAYDPETARKTYSDDEFYDATTW
jgi:hypothetical protein